MITFKSLGQPNDPLQLIEIQVTYSTYTTVPHLKRSKWSCKTPLSNKQQCKYCKHYRIEKDHIKNFI